MRKFIACLHKEALLLLRDRAGLVMLFCLPIALAVIVTLVQEDAFRTMDGRPTALLLVDQDGGELALELGERLREGDAFLVQTDWQGVPLQAAAGRQLVLAGKSQACLVIPKGFTRAVRARSAEIIAGTLDGAAKPGGTRLEITFDPALRPIIRKALRSGLLRLAQATETRELLTAVGRQLGGLEGASGDLGEDPDAAPQIDWRPGDLVGLDEPGARTGPQAPLPTSVQQNVPAWTLFAMFMVVIPLAGGLVKERQMGTMTRLRMLPVPAFTLLGAKVTAYLFVCLSQFAAMVLIGMWIMPRLGTPAFGLGSHLGAVASAAVVAGLAATGSGMLIGTLVRTTDQAAIFGSALVVIASALGGVMVPPFMMPGPLRLVSAFSPLNWGLTAFLDIFLRGAGLAQIWPNLALLTALAAATMLAAVWRYRHLRWI
jgi:ABC-2 type transport system permease protein